MSVTAAKAARQIFGAVEMASGEVSSDEVAIYKLPVLKRS